MNNILDQYLIPVAAMLVLVYSLGHLVWLYFFKPIFDKMEIEAKDRNRMLGHLLLLCLVVFTAGAIILLDYNQSLATTESFDFRVVHIFELIGILEIARILDLFFNLGFPRKFYGETSFLLQHKSKLGKIVRRIIYLLASMVIVTALELNRTLLQFQTKELLIDIKVNRILWSLLVFLIGQLLYWLLTHLIFPNYYHRKSIPRGQQIALNRLLGYVIYTFTIIIAIDALGINITLLLGGTAALLVGIGLGLQDVFKDFVSGIVLLSERSIRVGDIIQNEQITGTVKNIGLRSSEIISKDDIVLLVPNSNLTQQNVVNLSSVGNRARFTLDIGVAYKSDVETVQQCLNKAAFEHPNILKHPNPYTRLADFADSALHFQLVFWTKEMSDLYEIQSDLRLRILQLFREKNIEIPFPQRDLWFRNNSANESL